MSLKRLMLRVLHQEGNNKKSELIYSGTALCDENKKLVYRDADSLTRLEWNETKRQLTIIRKAQAESVLVLKDGRMGTIEVKSEYGVLRLENRTRFILIEKNRWAVQYDVINGNERMTNRFTWIMKEAEDEQS